MLASRGWTRSSPATSSCCPTRAERRGGVDKLEIYRRLGVREVWFWIDEALAIYVLGVYAYTKEWGEQVDPGPRSGRPRTSSWQPIPSKQTETIRAYRRALRAR